MNAYLSFFMFSIQRSIRQGGQMLARLWQVGRSFFTIPSSPNLPVSPSPFCSAFPPGPLPARRLPGRRVDPLWPLRAGGRIPNSAFHPPPFSTLFGVFATTAKIHGQPTQPTKNYPLLLIRISIGLATHFADVYHFMGFATVFRDKTILKIGEVTFDIQSFRVIRDGS